MIEPQSYESDTNYLNLLPEYLYDEILIYHRQNLKCRLPSWGYDCDLFDEKQETTQGCIWIRCVLHGELESIELCGNNFVTQQGQETQLTTFKWKLKKMEKTKDAINCKKFFKEKKQ